MDIKNKRCSNIKVCSPNKLTFKLKILCFEIAYFANTKRLTPSCNEGSLTVISIKLQLNDSIYSITESI